ncbi:hypothetical protein JTE90_000469 [Oedothorax gibbosus]|uniref:Uncharacterized protein n=1 Tax=Oedothorax gibbosus TaxID=931172 RepID=A0AAV6TJM0_9ARAC|nr:hypothetical protein JTE90_000469 [Oedothorax gibbosus]
MALNTSSDSNSETETTVEEVLTSQTKVDTSKTHDKESQTPPIDIETTLNSYTEITSLITKIKRTLTNKTKKSDKTVKKNLNDLLFRIQDLAYIQQVQIDKISVQLTESQANFAQLADCIGKNIVQKSEQSKEKTPAQQQPTQPQQTPYSYALVVRHHKQKTEILNIIKSTENEQNGKDICKRLQQNLKQTDLGLKDLKINKP